MGIVASKFTGGAAGVAGADTQVQFNDGGAFAGDSGLVWDKTNNVLGISPGALYLQMGTSGAYATGSGIIAADAEIFDSFTPGSGNWYYGTLVYHRAQNGTGHRAAQEIVLEVTGHGATDMLVGIAPVGHIVSGGGYAFGSNPYAWVSAGADVGCQGVGEEVNTDIRRNIAVKIGIQIVDVSTSTGQGLTYDAALRIDKQGGARGYDQGILFVSSPNLNLISAPNFGLSASGVMTINNETGVNFKNSAGTAKQMLRFTSADALIIGQELGTGCLYMNINGSVKRLTVDGNNFVKIVP